MTRPAPRPRRLRLGIFVESSLTSGGGFQQSLSTVEAIINSTVVDDYDLVVLTVAQEVGAEFTRRGIPTHVLTYPHVHRLIDELSTNPLAESVLRKIRAKRLEGLGRYLDAYLDDQGIDIVLFTQPSAYALRMRNRPYIYTVWDLSHRDGHEFPEVRHEREYERRERLLNGPLPKALAVIVSGVHDAQAVTDLYQVKPERVVVVPFLPAVAVREHAAGAGRVTADEVRRKYELPEQFIFYPAGFWPHKNHVYILEGMAALERDYNMRLTAVFCGSDKGCRDLVHQRARELGLADRVRDLGFVTDDEIPALYDAALSLVMPTYFGPTNLPPLEALLLGCPVIYADFPEFRREFGDAVRYCDLRSPDDLAAKMAELIKEAEVEAPRLRHRDSSMAESHDQYATSIRAILADYDYLRRRWSGWPPPD